MSSLLKLTGVCYLWPQIYKTIDNQGLVKGWFCPKGMRCIWSLYISQLFFFYFSFYHLTPGAGAQRRTNAYCECEASGRMDKVFYFLIWILKKVLKKKRLSKFSPVFYYYFFFPKSLCGSVSASPWWKLQGINQPSVVINPFQLSKEFAICIILLL